MAIKQHSQGFKTSELKPKSSSKKTVSFAKFPPPHSTTTTTSCESTAEKRLQSLGSRRLYQRRGSKTPAMLRLTKSDMVSVRARSEKEGSSRQPRRLSLMSALRQKLEQSCRVVDGVSANLVLPHHERKLGSSYALEMLS